MLLLMGLAVSAAAFNPQPEPPALENRLYAVVNNLAAARVVLSTVLAHPPEPGAVAQEGRLYALEILLGVLHERVDDVLHPPDPGSPPPDDERVLTALGAVRDQAQGVIADIIRSRPPPDDQRFLGVHDGAQAIVDLADEFLSDPTVIGGGQ